MKFAVLVTGSRDWTDYEVIKREIISLRPTAIIEGGATGADELAAQCARELDIMLLEIPADWEKYGKAAGPLRNQQMLDVGKPDFVLAFHQDFAASKGTYDMVIRANKAGIPVRLIAR